MADRGYPDLKAFPSPHDAGQMGITIREYLAAAALPGVIAGCGTAGITPEFAAQKAVEYADAMIQELMKKS